MICKHFFKKYRQKYQLFLSFTTILAIISACSTTKKLTEEDFLLTKNEFKYLDNNKFSNEIPDFVLQNPNSKTFFFLPIGLWFYNATNPKYDAIFREYSSYPAEMKNQKLRDSLYIKYGYPELAGKSLWIQRLLHKYATPPSIYNPNTTYQSAENIRKRLVYRGFWDAKVSYDTKIDSLHKTAKVQYNITYNEPTKIRDFHQLIPDSLIYKNYQWDIANSFIKKGHILDQTELEAEVSRINQQMQDIGIYKFNESGEDIFFTADTLQNKKNIPLFLEIRRDKPYHISKIGKIQVSIKNNVDEILKKDSLAGIYINKNNDNYKNIAIWRAIVLKPNEKYSQRRLDLTRRNLASMDNFNISADVNFRKGSDSIVDVHYTLIPLPKYNLKISGDIAYSQILNIGFSPSIDLTRRNIFGGGENLNTTFSGTFGYINSTTDKDKKTLASEISAQVNLSFPRLLLPFKSWKVIPKRYSPSSSINLGTTIQNNLGLGRLNFNTGLHYSAIVNQIVSHQLSLFNTQLSLTRNKNSYYDFFPREKAILNNVFKMYDTNLYNQYLSGTLSGDDLQRRILADANFEASLQGSDLETYYSFVQSLYNKDRQTQDVIISSFIYNFTYNEIGKSYYKNPFYFNAKIENAGSMLSLFFKKHNDKNQVFKSEQNTFFNIPYSQFLKIDLDIRKYFSLFNNHTLIFRQLIGIGIPYGNSTRMPFVRSYFNGGSNDIRAWHIYGGLGPADSQLDEKVRSFIMENMKLTTNIEYRMPFNKMFEGAVFVDAGNIWSLNDNHSGAKFKFNKFLSQMGVGSGIGVRINIAYITLRMDYAYKLYDPNQPIGNRWVIQKWKPFDGVLNFGIGYPF